MGRGHGGKGVRMCGARLGRVGGRRAGSGALPTNGIPALSFGRRRTRGAYRFKKFHLDLKNRPRERHVAVAASPCAGGRLSAGSGGGGQHSPSLTRTARSGGSDAGGRQKNYFPAQEQHQMSGRRAGGGTHLRPACRFHILKVRHVVVVTARGK